jgi:hypothetical protein
LRKDIGGQKDRQFIFVYLSFFEYKTKTRCHAGTSVRHSARLRESRRVELRAKKAAEIALLPPQHYARRIPFMPIFGVLA